MRGPRICWAISWHVEPQAGNLKIEKMTPDLPAGLWESLHELEGMFDQMAGMPPVMQGQGEQGVRAQGHAVGKSLVETNLKATAKRILETAKKKKCTVILPVDGGQVIPRA